MKIKKAIIPIAGLGTRFLPLSKAMPKEFWPLVDKPVLQYIIEEVRASGIKEIILINRPDKEEFSRYFKKYLKKTPELEALLKMRKKKNLLDELKSLEKIANNISFSYIFQKKPLGDGHALLQAQNLIRKESFAVLWADDVVESKTPCLLQLVRIFKKYKRPVMALYRIPEESFKFYGMVGVKKLANKTYRINKIIEKPAQIKDSPSNLAIVGKYIFTPEVFKWLKDNPLNKNRELITDEVLGKVIEEGKEIYGYEFEGRWLECGNKLAYLKSNSYLSLKHPQFGKEIKKFLK
jgi:UTP--glucose-1-phosphate uridylyltransferase